MDNLAPISAASRAFAINEVTHEILLTAVDLCKQDSRVGADQRFLAAAATICKAISGPALDILWADLHGVTPLLSLLGPPEPGAGMVRLC